MGKRKILLNKVNKVENENKAGVMVKDLREPLPTWKLAVMILGFYAGAFLLLSFMAFEIGLFSSMNHTLLWIAIGIISIPTAIFIASGFDL
jgi:hypothetical protein